jgi:hypothetical protein
LIESFAQEAMIDPAEGTADGPAAIGSGRLGVGILAFSPSTGVKIVAEA